MFETRIIGKHGEKLPANNAKLPTKHEIQVIVNPFGESATLGFIDVSKFIPKIPPIAAATPQTTPKISRRTCICINLFRWLSSIKLTRTMLLLIRDIICLVFLKRRLRMIDDVSPKKKKKSYLIIPLISKVAFLTRSLT